MTRTARSQDSGFARTVPEQKRGGVGNRGGRIPGFDSLTNANEQLLLANGSLTVTVVSG